MLGVLVWVDLGKIPVIRDNWIAFSFSRNPIKTE